MTGNSSVTSSQSVQSTDGPGVAVGVGDGEGDAVGVGEPGTST